MSDKSSVDRSIDRIFGSSVKITGYGGIGWGVYWFVYGKLGFWWALVYGLGWPGWVGYRMAEWLWR